MSINNETSIAKSAVLTVAMRWADRLIGIVSTLILARLLLPDDFGIVAMATLVVGLMLMITDMGVHIALIQNTHAEQAHYNTAWTIRLVQYSFVALVIFFSAPYASEYFNDQRVTLVLRVLCLQPLMMGLMNIGIVNFQKDMQFGLDFRFMFIKRVAGFLTTIVLAVLLRSYWSMVFGTLVGTATGVLLSYTMHPMRPRLSLARFSSVFAVSQWALLRSVGSYLEASLDRFLIGGREDSRAIAGYTVANEIAMMPSGELVAPLNRVLFPAFARLKEDTAELSRVFLLAIGVQAMISIPASVGLSLIAGEAVQVLLGQKWMFAVPFLQVLALNYVLRSIATGADHLMITLGEIRSAVLINWSSVILFAGLAIVMWPEAKAQEIAGIRLFSTLAGLVMTFVLLKRIAPDVPLTGVLRAIMRPLFAAVAMMLVLTRLPTYFDLSPLVMLLTKIALGALVYGVAIGLSWLALGKPAGAEAYLLGQFAGVTRRFTGSVST